MRPEAKARRTVSPEVKAAWIGAVAVVIAAIIGAGWFVSHRSNEVSGQVFEAVTGTVIPQATVSVVGIDTETTDDNGKFSFEPNVPSDEKEVLVVITKTGYAPSKKQIALPKRGWLVELSRQAEPPPVASTSPTNAASSGPPPKPNASTSASSSVSDSVPTADPIYIDFKPNPSGRPAPGCLCGSREISFPDGPYSTSVGKEFIFRYEDSGICRGQGFDNFHGVISRGMAQNLP